MPPDWRTLVTTISARVLKLEIVSLGIDIDFHFRSKLRFDYRTIFYRLIRLGLHWGRVESRTRYYQSRLLFDALLPEFWQFWTLVRGRFFRTKLQEIVKYSLVWA